jgi:hypothetical protein
MRKRIVQAFLLPILFLFFSAINFAQLSGQLPIAPSSIPQFVDPLPHIAGLRVDVKLAAILLSKWFRTIKSPYQLEQLSTVE